jgi:tetratricopeptide (TPR) repeat protein
LFVLVVGLSPRSGLAPVAAADSSNAEERVDRLIRLNNLGLAELARFKESAALVAFREALALDPGYAEAQTNLGIALLAAADYQAAEAALRRGAALDPGSPYPHFNLGLLYKLQGKTPDALESFEAVRRLDADDPDTLYQLGTLYARARQPERAIPAFRRALELAPENISVTYGLGQALLQAGNPDEGKKYLELSQQMKAASGLNVTVGTRYGEQGKYSYAVEDDRVATLARGPAPKPVPVKFAAVDAAAAGIAFRHGAPEGESPTQALTCADGSGGALEDLDDDDDLDLYLVDCAANGGGDRLYRNDGGWKFTDITAQAGLGPPRRGLGVSVGDYDNDRRPDLAVSGLDGLRLYHNLGGGKFEERGAGAGVSTPGPSAGVAWADVDHDGDLDLYVVRRSDPASASTRNVLFINRGDGTFDRGLAPAGLGGNGAAGTGLVFTDFDNDRDIDLVLPKLDGPWQMLSNDRVGTFTDVAAASGQPPPAHAVTAGDFDKDGRLDLAATGPGGVMLLRNAGGGLFSPDARVAAAAAAWIKRGTPAVGVVLADIDNDGYLDLAAAAASGKGAALVLLRNAGEGMFSDWTRVAGLDRVRARRGRGLLAGDLDADGDVDLVLTNAGGPPTLLRNDGGSARSSLAIDVVGKGSNRSGVGAKVEVKAGRLWQKLEVESGSGYLSGGPTRLHLGLGERASADTVRVLWPSGVLQDEIDVEAGRIVSLEELDRKGSSCPILYAWDGDRFAFVTDFLGGAAIGARVSATAFNHPDTDEYVRVRGDQLRARDGRLELRMVNQLEEVIFVDRARLLAIDHPAEIAVYPNERLLEAPPFPPFVIYAVTSERPPVTARDERGEDLRPLVLDEDRRWPAGFRLLPFKGYAEEHALELDPGPIPKDAHLVLLADAWIDYADSSSNLAASQAGIELLPPRLDVVGEDGEWRVALPQMGFPAGLPKTLAVDLTDLVPRQGDRRIRIVTSMRIYWDRIRFGIVDASAALRTSPLEAESAEVRFHGYPALVSADGKPPFAYDYATAAATAGWKDFEGAFTRYGDVRELLSAIDDRFVTLRHGDEIALGFAAAELPPLPEGWARDYLVYADGFGKDMDVNSARPDRVGPLPYHAMSSYPPPPGELPPLDAARLEWLRSLERRRVAGGPPALR